MVIGRMISQSFCWAIMKKMTKKWDLETSNEETEPIIGIYAKKLIKIGPVQKFWLWSKSQRSTLLVNGPVCWCHWMTCDADMAVDMLGLTWCSEELSTCSTWHDWRIVTEACQAHEACKSACSVFSTSRNLGGAWGCVGAPLGQFLVRFWLEKSDLSRCNCGSTIDRKSVV